MYSDIMSASINGLEATIVHVETDVGMGLPTFEMCGFLGMEVKEAKERVRVAIKNAGIELRPQRIVINISPANIRKDGTAFDLPIALGILAANGLIERDCLKQLLVLGELSLDGTIHAVKGVLPCVSAAIECGITTCIIPFQNRKEAAIVDGAKVLPAKSLLQVINFLNGKTEIFQQEKEHEAERIFCRKSNEESCKEEYTEDYSDIRGQYAAKRATMIAVAGMHNVIYVGTPGSGKTMMARRIPTIMPELSYDESLQVTKTYSVAGILEQDGGLIRKRPFRSPHHNITETALLGGGRIPRPGEVTLAGKGVLFLDELTEFRGSVLESLRQPLEDKEITIVRLHTAYTYPADFMLAAAMNPCKCGYYPDRNRCNCSEHDIRRYLGRISTPMWDRFDICVQTEEVKYIDMVDSDLQKKRNAGKEERTEDCMDSAYMRQCVERARVQQQKRFTGRKISFNSQMTAKDIKKYCILDEVCQHRMKECYEKLHLTARGYHKILKTARTIADIEESEVIRDLHLSEAIAFRSYELQPI